ncbi:hypothetical protein [Streptomyces doebereineriae]|uniref:hypothetical protein n=1 Tax=Streptomyces doebereineriae TaxID=3075528 RepID=UPI0028897D15|nr:hypothetical protein [Streptomyces sp. DSM 41640]
MRAAGERPRGGEREADQVHLKGAPPNGWIQVQQAAVAAQHVRRGVGGDAVALVDSAGPVDGVCVEQGAYRPLVGEVELGGEGASADVADALGGGLRRVRVDVAMSGAA